jgi:hypothetical protein
VVVSIATPVKHLEPKRTYPAIRIDLQAVKLFHYVSGTDSDNIDMFNV